MEQIKVACLTTHNDNTLMWSHYADKHQGICIEYNIDNIFDKEKLLLKKITYNKEAINFDILENRQNNIMVLNKDIIYNVLADNKYLDHVIELFTIKSKEWEYEDEYRILLYDEENKNPNGAVINLPIKSICFGVQTSDDDKELVCNVVESINKTILDYRNDTIKLYQASLDENELFKININPYKPDNK